MEAGMQEVNTYIARRNNNVAQLIATRPIVDLCLAVVRHPREQVLKEWW